MVLSTRSAFFGGFVLWAAPALTWQALSLIGVGSWTSVVPLAGFLFAPLLLVFALFASAFRALPKARAAATKTTSAALGLFAGICFALVMSATWYTTAIELATHRAQPLVEAIERYERENGRPPPALNVLVPQYLDRIPRRIPPFELAVTLDYPPNEWILKSNEVGLVQGLDELFYLPHGNYEDFAWSGSIQRLGAWAYLRD